jgi:hypothetical protein
MSRPAQTYGPILRQHSRPLHSSTVTTLALRALPALAATAIMAACSQPASTPAATRHERSLRTRESTIGPQLPSPMRVCGQAFLRGPSKPPRHAVVVPAGDNSRILGDNWLLKPHTTYWLAPGRHVLGPGIYSQVRPATGDTFLGGYDPRTSQVAVLDGQGVNASAFDGTATDVTIKYLVIQHFIPRSNQYVVNHDDASNWTIEYDTIRDNGAARGSSLGAALGMGSADIVEHNCLTHNGQYGLNAGGVGTEFNYNEIAWNGISYFPDDQCGCSGGIKYWDATDATIVGNYIHDNYNVGLWVDTDNAGFLIKDNYIADNWAEGIVYEISYNAEITGNILLDNGWGVGSASAGGFPYGDAIYVNGSGGDPDVASNYAGTFAITDNVLTDNWDGIVIYQNPNRLCGSTANSSTGYCTRGRGAPFTIDSCAAHDAGGSPSERPDYWDGCQWKAANVTVTGNQFNFNPADIATALAPLPEEDPSRCPTTGAEVMQTGSNASAPGVANQYWCGFNGMFSLPGSASSGPAAGWTVCDAIMNLTNSTGESPDNNIWKDNTYSGPWAFQAYAQGHSPVQGDISRTSVPTTVNLSGWQATWHQDTGSTLLPLAPARS